MMVSSGVTEALFNSWWSNSRSFCQSWDIILDDVQVSARYKRQRHVSLGILYGDANV
jgi:hypothetical protein